MITASTSSVDETRSLGERLSAALTPGVVLVLIGGLGAGKTALAQGIGRGLGVRDRITSPTFTMVATYPTSGRGGIEAMLHADLYRVDSGVEADDLSIAELVEEAAVAVVEWGDVAPDVLGDDRLVIRIDLGQGTDDRRFSFDCSASRSLDDAALLAVLAQ